MNVFFDLELFKFSSKKIMVDKQKLSLVFINDDRMADSVLSNNLNAHEYKT